LIKSTKNHSIYLTVEIPSNAKATTLKYKAIEFPTAGLSDIDGNPSEKRS